MSRPVEAVAPAARDDALPRWLPSVALVGSLAALGLRVLATVSAGPLWRDEAGSASTATVATFAEFWSRLALDSFPLLWHLLLRVWTTALWDGSDTAIRALGLLIGTALVPALWWTSRALGVVPLASTLAAVTPLFVFWSGVQSRAYGLAAVLLALLVGAVWRVVERASPGRIAVATVIALLAVHTTYHLPVMLAAVLAGAAAVGAVRRDRRLVVIAVTIGVLCAVSLLVYSEQLARTRLFSKVVYAQVSPSSIVRGLRFALAPGGALGVAVVALATVLCAWGAIVALRALAAARARGAAAGQVVHDGSPAADAVLFAGTAGVAAALIQGPFLLSLRFLVQPWYYPTVVLVLAIALDVVLQRTLLTERVRTMGLVALAVLLAVAIVPSAQAVSQRQSNLDLVAAYLKEHVRPGDLIVVYPWHYGVSFQRYYDGAVPFMTVPDVAGHDHYRYDQLAELMRDPERIKPGFRRIFQTLQAGGGVWVVGSPASDVPPQFRVPAVPTDDDPMSWNDNRYSLFAGLQLRWVLQQGAAQEFPVAPLTDGAVRDYENAPLTLYATQPR